MSDDRWYKRFISGEMWQAAAAWVLLLWLTLEAVACGLGSIREALR